MNRHQVLTGAANFGDRCFAVGSVEGVHFTAYASGCNIVILASDFSRVQIIPGAVYGSDVQVTCVTCCCDVGKIAASYGNRVCVFEPTPLLSKSTSHVTWRAIDLYCTPLFVLLNVQKLDYQWYHTGTFQTTCEVTALAWNMEGTRLLTAGTALQIWEAADSSSRDEPVKPDIEFYIEDQDGPSGVIGGNQPGYPLTPCSTGEDRPINDPVEWGCVWNCRTATPVTMAKFSSDGLLFATAGENDRLVKIWYENKQSTTLPLLRTDSISPRRDELSFSFIYISHPRAVTGFSWRRTSKFLHKGAVANMLLTSCKDQICRVWAETMLPDDGLMEVQPCDLTAAGLSNGSAPVLHSQRNKRFLQKIQQIRGGLQARRRPTGPQAAQPSVSTMSLQSQTSKESGQASLHDFHKYNTNLNTTTPTLHFHLAASINSNTDIPLMGSLTPNNQGFNANFVVHWLNNKEIHASLEAERIMKEVRFSMEAERPIKDQLARQATPTDQSDAAAGSGGIDSDEEGGVNASGEPITSPSGSARAVIGHEANGMTSVTSDPVINDLYKGIMSKRKVASMRQAKSFMSLESDKSAVNSEPGAELNQTNTDKDGSTSELGLEARLEQLMRDWHQGVDMLFSIHPTDGSFLVWLIDYLDEPQSGTFRQATVSFSSLIPNAFPLYDALTMAPHLWLYRDYGDGRSSPRRAGGGAGRNGLAGLRSMRRRQSELNDPCRDEAFSPEVMLLTKHSNGTLNLWKVAFAEMSHFASVVSVSHASRASGHRFHANGAACHPVLPLLLTTSHHTAADSLDDSLFLHDCEGESGGSKGHEQGGKCARKGSNRHAAMMGGYCCELILWRVIPVGPLSRSGGITELARMSSPVCAAFSNVAWLPTLLPCSSLGRSGNSPSALFVASDGSTLRLYQAVLDARAVLKENQQNRNMGNGLQDSGVSNGQPVAGGPERFNVVSVQSTARPGCIIELSPLADSVQKYQTLEMISKALQRLRSDRSFNDGVMLDWENIELMHVFQEQLVTGSRSCHMDMKGHGGVEAMVNLQNAMMFEEHFYLVILERKTAVLHMWKIVIASQDSGPDYDYSPDVVFSDGEGEEIGGGGRGHPNNSPGQQQQNNADQPSLYIRSHKVCKQTLTLPAGVKITSATVAAGHLSSSSIYPACYAPYLFSTACSDRCVRFWCCNVSTNHEAGFVEGEGLMNGGMVREGCYSWTEWEMMIRNEESSLIHMPGQILSVSCAYSGRVAIAYRPGTGRKISNDPRDQFSNLKVSIYECESTGGSEWTLEDTIELRNIEIPIRKLDLDLSVIYDTELTTLTLPSIDHHSSTMVSYSSVPSCATVQSVKRFLSTNQLGVVQSHLRHLIHLDWVSTEDGSHVLTVGVGPKILLYAAVTNEMAIQKDSSNKQAATEPSAGAAARGQLQKTKSMAVNAAAVQDIRWLSLRSIELMTADGLAPLPMHVSWVRNGILVVGMDNEMQIYSQWRDPNDEGGPPVLSAVSTEPVHQVTGSSSFLAPSKSVSRSTSGLKLDASILNLCLLAEKDKDKKSGGRHEAGKTPSPGPALMQDSGLFEAARMAHPNLPQYHPKQLIELLNFGKIRRVKAILSHLVRCISGGGNASSGRRTNFSFGSTTGGQHSPVDPALGSSEECDYIEIASIPPLPLYALLAADEATGISGGADNAAAKRKQADTDYTNLFSFANIDDSAIDDAFDVLEVSPGGPASAKVKKTNPYQFTPAQADRLAWHLTHTELPGMASLDQMYLLALAQTVANTKIDFLDGEHPGKSEPGKQEAAVAESIDDCGLRFLFAARHRVYLMSTLPARQRLQLQQHGLSPASYVWAFHSESEEELIASLPSMQKGEPTWAEMKQFGAGWWIRNINTLTRCIEKVAKAAFQSNKDPMDAALFYIAMRKTSILRTLFGKLENKKMADFFKQNFDEERWRKAALKNAFSLLGKQKFLRAAAFFLLGGSVNDAVEVCLRTDDIQLAMVILRLYDNDPDPTSPSRIRSLLFERCLGCDTEGGNYDPSRASPDPFIRSMALWLMKDYSGSLATLLEKDIGEDYGRLIGDTSTGLDNYSVRSSVFNFYNYLRTHPLLVRHHLATSAAGNKSQAVLLSGFSHTGARKASHDALNVTYVDRITVVERRLYFMTAREHFKNGCPLLALEVLSKLPEVIDIENNITTSHSGDVGVERKPVTQDSVDWSKPATTGQTSSALDWSQPTRQFEEEKLDLAFSESEGEEEEEGESKQNNNEADKPDPEPTQPTTVITAASGGSGIGDIMAHQLKFIACIKILVDELSTLATGFEVQGGQLRYQLYVWLEKEVEVLKKVCGYICDVDATGPASTSDMPSESDAADGVKEGSTSELDGNASCKSLHEVMTAERQDFEAKLYRVERRRRWLKSNQLLLRTLMSYSVLHGAKGGGLASMRMELLLLLQELQQQQRVKHLLQSPLPFPTTLPLLSASVTSSSTVIADPIQYVQGMCQDVLNTLGDINNTPAADRGISKALLLRDVSTALSACLYQCLCDSESFEVSVNDPVDVGLEGFTSTSVVYKDSHLMTGAKSKKSSTSGSGFDHNSILELPSSPPAKWPGVSTLITLIDRKQDPDAPRLHVLLCESLIAVYISLLHHALTVYDANVLYRMVGHPLAEKMWPLLYGGGAKKLIQVQVTTSDTRLPADELQKQRLRLQNRLMGPAAVNQRFKDDKRNQETYQERFIPPQTNMVRHFMTKMSKDEDRDNDYDSADSISSDEEEEEEVIIGSMTKNNTALNEHLDPRSYSWTLMRYAIVKYIRHSMQTFLPSVGVDLSDLPTWSQLVHNVLKNLEHWEKQLYIEMEGFPGPPLDYIPGCYVDNSNTANGVTKQKYQALYSPANTPFRSSHYSAKPAKRLWHFLVNREYLQDIFIRYVFRKQRVADDVALLKCSEPQFIVEPMKIVHKDQDMLSCFCLNQANQNSVVIATQKELIEMNIRMVLDPPDWIVDEMGVERDIEVIKNQINQPDKPEEFLVIRAPYDNRIMGSGGSAGTPSGSGGISMGQLGHGGSLQTKRAISGVRRMAAHPALPYYLTGSQDGCVRLWEWNRAECVSELRKPGAFPKVTKVLFNEQGNKFGVSDIEGNIGLWQVNLGLNVNKPYLSLKCHSKVTSDFAFVGASSLIASAGHSTDNRNVCLWDTLLPQRKGPIQSFLCHIDGCPALLYAPQHQALICGGKKGEICIFDVRQRQLRQTFQAHESSVKCMALDPSEECFVTGSADGDIKVWGLAVHNLLHSFPGEHSKGSSLFRHSGTGVTQLLMTSRGHLMSSGADGSLKVRQLPHKNRSSFFS